MHSVLLRGRATGAHKHFHLHHLPGPRSARQAPEVLDGEIKAEQHPQFLESWQLRERGPRFLTVLTALRLEKSRQGNRCLLLRPKHPHPSPDRIDLPVQHGNSTATPRPALAEVKPMDPDGPRRKTRGGRKGGSTWGCRGLPISTPSGQELPACQCAQHRALEPGQPGRD